MIILFFVGVLEMIIATMWTKTVTSKMIWGSGVVTMVNVLVWFYVLQQVIDNIHNWYVVVLYALGCSLGTVICTAYYRYREVKSLTAAK
jgi:uncharacterized protein YebE (UPF0316 family)